MAKTKKPTGLSIARSVNVYTLKWKIGDSDYANGQQLQYSLNGGAWTAITIGATATTATVTNASVRSLVFRVMGNRKAYKKNGRKINPGWSAWAQSATWSAAIPATPTLEYANNSVNSGTFTWNTESSDSSTQVLTEIQKQTCTVTRTGEPAESDWGSITTGTASGLEVVTEDSEALAAGNLVRWYRVRSSGPAGVSPWVTTSHAYGTPAAAVIDSASAETNGSVTRVTASWRAAYDDLSPIDTITLQYAVAVPTDTALTAPASGWSDAIEVTPNGGEDKVVVNVQAAIAVDECMWVRVKTDHDTNLNYSGELVAQADKLGAPTIAADPDTSTGSVNITITETTTCNVACTAIFCRLEDDPSNDRIIGVLAHGVTSGTYSVPDIIGDTTTCFGAFAFVGTYSGAVISQILMRSDSAIDSDIDSEAPASITLEKGPSDETVRIGWTWTWDGATQAELAWADHAEAWESTDEPDTYTVKDRRATSWVIAGLDTGLWYFRVRLINASVDPAVVGPWSETYTYNMSSIPDKPALTLNKSVINSGDTVTARWAYSSVDGSPQGYAEICSVTYSNSHPVYGDIIAHVDSGQSVEITQDWQTGQTYYMAVRTTSESGVQSEWSEPVSLYVAEPCTIALTGSSITRSTGSRLSTTTVTDTKIYDPNGNVIGGSTQRTQNSATFTTGFDSDKYERYLAGDTVTTSTEPSGVNTIVTTVTTTLDSCPEPIVSAMPITANITGAGATGTTVMAIARAENYHIDRPDENDYDGFEGETIATTSRTGEGQLTIALEDLVGSLDDGCWYYLIGHVYDEFGQSASFKYPFQVNWSHKAGVPDVSVTVDKYLRIAKITPIAPSGAVSSDTCDIYRLTADKPELIYKGASFGTTYVDPYPGFGDACGHRLVTVTANGDYATASGLGWRDADVNDGDFLDEEQMIIDVDGEQIELPYNLSLSNKWNKDFKRTSYLGGSVQGDWNPAVTRDLSADTVLVRGLDLDRQMAMRDLAGFAGVAHVRTPDGSSLTADVQINEEQSYDTKKVSYSLTISAVDPEEPAGMTLDEWETLHPVNE